MDVSVFEDHDDPAADQHLRQVEELSDATVERHVCQVEEGLNVLTKLGLMGDRSNECARDVILRLMSALKKKKKKDNNKPCMMPAPLIISKPASQPATDLLICFDEKDDEMAGKRPAVQQQQQQQQQQNEANQSMSSSLAVLTHFASPPESSASLASTPTTQSPSPILSPHTNTRASTPCSAISDFDKVEEFCTNEWEGLAGRVSRPKRTANSAGKPGSWLPELEPEPEPEPLISFEVDDDLDMMGEVTSDDYQHRHQHQHQHQPLPQEPKRGGGMTRQYHTSASSPRVRPSSSTHGSTNQFRNKSKPWYPSRGSKFKPKGHAKPPQPPVTMTTPRPTTPTPTTPTPRLSLTPTLSLIPMAKPQPKPQPQPQRTKSTNSTKGSSSTTSESQQQKFLICPDWLQHQRYPNLARPCPQLDVHKPYFHCMLQDVPQEVRECAAWRMTGECPSQAKGEKCLYEHFKTAHGRVEGAHYGKRSRHHYSYAASNPSLRI